MADRTEYTNNVPDFTGRGALTLEIGTRAGQVFIRLLSKREGETLQCLLQPDEAETVGCVMSEAARKMKAAG